MRIRCCNCRWTGTRSELYQVPVYDPQIRPRARTTLLLDYAEECPRCQGHDFEVVAYQPPVNTHFGQHGHTHLG
jgi:hypothetical protein